MSKKKDNSFYIKATCKANKDNNWICKSVKPDVESCEEVEIQRAIDSYELELKKMLDVEYADFSVSLVYRIGASVNRSLTDFEIQEAEA